TSQLVGMNLVIFCSWIGITCGNKHRRVIMTVLNSSELVGPLSPAVGNLSFLRVLWLSRNSFTGQIPGEVGKLSRLRRLNLANNSFSGEIPTNISRCSNLNYIHLAYLGNHCSLLAITLGDNQLHGKIPDIFGGLRNLVFLDFALNYLAANIGKTTILEEYIGNMSNLLRLSVGGNIPIEILQLENLQVLGLEKNNFTGMTPESIGQQRQLRRLYFDHNRFSGEIPHSLGNLTRLIELDLGSNKLQGTVPSSHGSCKFLSRLYLNGNQLSGLIPKELFELSLIEFDLSNNHLTGHFPVGIGSGNLTGLINLIYMNHSYKNLSEAFRNMSAVSLVGNSELSGGIPEFKMPKCSNKVASKRHRLSHRLIIVMLVIGGLLAAITVALLIFLCARRKKRSTSSENSSLDVIPRVTYNSLYKETNGFSMSNMIGSGALSFVYRGILEENGKFVAIKVLKLQVTGASKSFLTECEALRHIKHRNLVKLLTSCSSIDYQGNDFKALVYEYMANGNLANWLHNRSTDGEENHEPKTWNILQRLNVIIDVASALDYLHHQSGTPLTHCDIKPNNVLLDEDFVAHLGDFGLARFLPDAAKLLSLSQSASSLNIRGTIGYVPPGN
ncbi:hypothetical protein EJD97_004329, partial [Solanum chilense]